jgi:formyltetrahydrofolate-dependent phosphoribosylglycinamide formyltransferase
VSLPVAVFASGSGSNLQAILDYHATLDAPPWRVELVISDQEDAGALRRARRSGIRSRFLPFAARSSGDLASVTLDILRSAEIGFIALAGYLRLVPADIVEAFRERMVNIHPALLPAFGGKGMYGMRVHEAVLASGARVTGPTVHFVDEEYDRGPIIAQWPVPVRAGDDPHVLAARVLRVEHLLYPRVVDHLGRALARGCRPTPFSPPGAAFLAVSEAGADAERSISAGFTGD